MPKTNECVGTLLVPSSDLQELSSSNTSTESNLQRRVTAGTLLVPSSVLSSPSENSSNSSSSGAAGLVRRMTDKVNSLPTPTDEEVRDWAGDA